VPTVARLNITPVKSTALHHPNQIRLERYGAVGNREFFFADEDGRRLSGSKKALLIPIRADYDASNERLTLRLPDGIDARPVTLVSLASVEELSRQGGRDRPVDARRFRMLIEVDGCAPHDEDTWAGRRVRVGEAVVLVGDPVPRCVITTLDPQTGTRDFPTLKVIRSYRGVSAEGELLFGVYGDVVEPGAVHVGDEVELLD